MDTLSPQETETRLKQEVSTFIDAVKIQMKESESVYSENVFRIFDEINSQGAETVFFLDRSARPVAWMMEGLYKGLQKPAPDFKFISIVNISEGRPTPQAIDEAKKNITFRKDKPVLIVDDFSESVVGKRLIDSAAQIVTEVFDLRPEDVNKTIFLKGTRRPAKFYNAHGFKDEIYGIKKATVNSIVSVPANSPSFLNDLRNEYVNLFINFGKQVAQTKK